MKWVRVTSVKNIPPREGRSVKLGSEEIAIFNLGDRFVAVDNACPHRGGPLCDGIVSGVAVVCPLHGYKVCLETGKVLKPELPVRVDSYPVRVENDEILVELSQKREKAA